MFSSLWVPHLASMRLDFTMTVPLLPSDRGFFFVFGPGYPFLVGSSIFLLLVVQQLVAILMFLQEEMNAHPSTLPSSSVQFSSVAQCLTLCDPMNCSTPDLPVHHQLPEFTQIHVH